MLLDQSKKASDSVAHRGSAADAPPRSRAPSVGRCSKCSARRWRCKTPGSAPRNRVKTESKPGARSLVSLLSPFVSLLVSLLVGHCIRLVSDRRETRQTQCKAGHKDQQEGRQDRRQRETEGRQGGHNDQKEGRQKGTQGDRRETRRPQ